MKKITQFFGIALFGLLLNVVSTTKTSAQIVSLFYETMGDGSTGNPIVNTYTGFDNYSNPNITYLGSGDVRTTSVSVYPGASKSNNVYLGSGKTFMITGIGIGNYDSLRINFGLYKSTIAEDGSSIEIIATIDGVNFPINVVLPTGASSSKWFEITTVETFPLGSVLNLSFANTEKGNNAFRIDDIYITGISDITTPIRLSKFTTSRSNNKTEIAWTTAMEYNNAYFEIERGSDGKFFEPIGSVESQNNSTGATYEFTDFNSLNGTSFYRLKSVDIDGKYEYSWISSVLENKDLISGIHLKANVVQSQLSLAIKVSNDQLISYAIYGKNGKKISQNNIRLGRDSDFIINVSSLTPGMYFLKTISGKEVNSFKFIKE